MSLQYPAGIISKTAIVPSGPYQTSTASGMWTIDQASAYIGANNWPTQGNIPAVGDTYWAYVQSLLHGDGTNGADNNTILDSSSSAWSLTRDGQTTQGTFTPYGSLWSNYFEGGTTYMTGPSSSAFALTGDFTVEAWVFVGDNSYNSIFCNSASTGTNTIWFGLYLEKAAIYSVPTGVISTSASIPLNTWTHIAYVRSGSTIKIYVNGTSSVTASNSSSFGSTDCLIGDGTVFSAPTFLGYMSNFRIVKSAVYTSNFTPSTTPLTAVVNTSLLTCQSNRIVDNSANGFTLTRTGGITVTRYSPFSPSSPGYSTTTYGGSVFFPQGGSRGSSSYTPLGLPNNSVFNLSGDFTFEFWVYSVPSTTAGGNNACYLGSDQASVNHQFGANATFTRLFLYHPTTGLQQSSAFASILNTWSYVAYVRSGSTVTFYLDGVSVGTVSSSQTYQFANGCVGALGGYGGYAPGYMSDVKLTKSALYSGTFTPPATPVTSSGSSILWLQGQNAGIPDNAMLQDWSTNNVTVNTSVKKYGTGSLAFNGTSSYLETSSNLSKRSPAFESFGLTFTIEFWFYRTSTDSNQWIVCTAQGYSDTSGTATGLLIGYYTAYGGGSLAIAGSGLGAYWFGGTTSIAQNQWVHCAVVGNGTSCVLYLDGVNVGSEVWPSGYSGFRAYGWSLGAGRSSSPNSIQNFIGGYIDDFRITNGVARYTANFTPPTSAFGNF